MLAHFHGLKFLFTMGGFSFPWGYFIKACYSGVLKSGVRIRRNFVCQGLRHEDDTVERRVYNLWVTRLTRFNECLCNLVARC